MESLDVQTVGAGGVLGALILPGRPGHYRLASPPPEDTSGDVRHIPVE